MSNKTLFLWGFIIAAMCGVILYRAYQLQDTELSKVQFKLRFAVKDYVEKENINLKINESKIIYIEDLVDKKYIKHSKAMDDYCLKSIVFTKGILVNNYKLNKGCEKIDLK